MHKPRVLFILKQRENYGEYGDSSDNRYEHSYSSGLLNSARMVVEMLEHHHFPVKLVQVVDNNCIDREVHKFKPDVVIIEALWVVPEKFEILHKLHPKVKWVIRGHSEIPFLSQEGVATDWLIRYLQYENVYIGFNSKKTHHDFYEIVSLVYGEKTAKERVGYLPNYYPVSAHEECYNLDKKTVIDVGCFGAIRPLKNQLIQAVAAVEYAKAHGLGLNFHINGGRVETGGQNAQKNIQALFEYLPSNFRLIQHNWLNHHHFTKLIRHMDIGLQMSFSETFNIVAADFVSQGVPIVTSDEIVFVSDLFHASCTDAKDIVKKMEYALLTKKWLMSVIDINKRNLRGFSKDSERIWTKYLK